ncbi:zinc ribbon domain-containing protein YjdM [Polynucleobacter sp. AM-26B4]|uniref:zinc ribbon domain-containing protein YjdM n=1 Tax=Polynucleobacter sp. AM-26B4 TaxID=2689103 RepID=UPI001C0CB37D|nr:zinc ribbon domain-containing protein YjdM [Polynucleobacter sp. AM-26B4]MBU3585114.1 alkylphosphonate utilization protein [Polynucleobacter sp. AM-26B4]
MPNNSIPACPVCGMENTYPDGENIICPDCSYEWPANTPSVEAEEKRIYKDAYGNILNDGDTVTLIKDLKVKGSSLVIKGGTKIKNIRLVDGDHDIDCKVDGQSMLLKSEFMKKA